MFSCCGGKEESEEFDKEQIMEGLRKEANQMTCLDCINRDYSQDILKCRECGKKVKGEPPGLVVCLKCGENNKKCVRCGNWYQRYGTKEE